MNEMKNDEIPASSENFWTLAIKGSARRASIVTPNTTYAIAVNHADDLMCGLIKLSFDIYNKPVEFVFDGSKFGIEIKMFQVVCLHSTGQKALIAWKNYYHQKKKITYTLGFLLPTHMN